MIYIGLILFLFFMSHLLKFSSSGTVCHTTLLGLESLLKLHLPLNSYLKMKRLVVTLLKKKSTCRQFQELNATEPMCASLLKSILCTEISDEQFSAKFFQVTSDINRAISILCNNTFPLDLCTKVVETCGNVSIVNSLFEHVLQDKIAKELCFCDIFGGSSKGKKACLHGEPTSLNNEQKTSLLPKGLCLEKIGDGSYIDMAPHPDGSNRAFFADRQGRIWLAKIPVEGSNETIGIDESKTLLDISDNLLFDSSHGLMSIAFHPNFSQNGRFFLSYNCDQMKNPTCSGRCACNSNVNCDPSKIGFDHDIFPCQYHCVVAEFTVNGTSSKPSLAESANPLEVRRIFTIGVPHIEGHAGQILFGPADGYLYLVLSDGSNRDDPYNFAQNKRSLLGKILRIDVDKIPSTKEINDMDLWGNYSIPKDNPYVNDKELEPEIWAFGFKDPWRCSFDSKRPSYFLCGDAGQDRYEEIDVVKKGKNYGWRVYEGPFLFHPLQSPGGNTSANSIHPIYPVFGYGHSGNDKNSGSASIVGGYFYRSMTDPCIYGRYLYTDMYTGSMLVGTESPENSGNFTSTKISSRCAHDSPMPCSFLQGNTTPSLGYVYSLAEDNNKDIYYLTSNGVYRVVRPSRCYYLCTKEKVGGLEKKKPHYSSSTSIQAFDFLMLLLFFTIHLMF